LLQIELEDGLVAFVQARRGGPDQVGGFGSRELDGGIFFGYEIVGRELGGLHARAVANSAITHVASDGEDPGVKPLGVAQLRHPLGNEHEDVLGRVGCFVRIAQQNRAEPTNAFDVLAVNLGERGSIAGPSALRQRANPHIPHARHSFASDPACLQRIVGVPKFGMDWSWPEQPPRRRDIWSSRARDIWSRVPPGTVDELGAAAWRLRTVRTPRQGAAALDAEIAHLFERIAPVLIDHPLPLRTRRAALTTVAITAGSAAALDEMEAIALLLPGSHVVAAPSLPLALGATFLALAVEAYAAMSLRVNLLTAAGGIVDPSLVSRDVLRAMTGREDVAMTKSATEALTGRVLRRWARGIVPLIGIGFATIDSQRTIREIARLPTRD
jgi:hypothetical protein